MPAASIKAQSNFHDGCCCGPRVDSPVQFPRPAAGDPVITKGRWLTCGVTFMSKLGFMSFQRSHWEFYAQDSKALSWIATTDVIELRPPGLAWRLGFCYSPSADGGHARRDARSDSED